MELWFRHVVREKLVRVEGQMVDAPLLAQAWRILDRARHEDG